MPEPMDPKDALLSPSPAERAASPAVKGFKERLYDRVRIPLRALDILIALLLIAIVVFTVLGMRPEA